MEEINALDLSNIIHEDLKKYLQSFHETVHSEEVGIVLESGDGIARIAGLPSAMMNEMLVFPSGIYGLVLNLEPEEIIAIVFGSHTMVKEGDRVKCSGHIMEVPVGKELLGRVVNSLGQPIDGNGPVETKLCWPLEHAAPQVIDREPVSQPLQTGYKIIDALVPIGRGQRELIIGDRQTGKTTLAIDTIINQKDKNVICIYVAIGQKSSDIVQTVTMLKKSQALGYTIIVDAPASDPGALQYIAPFSGCAMGEYFMYNEKKDVLIIFDDLTKHSAAYRMLSLLLRRPPGREAYPGDIFYLHARLLERGAKLNQQLGGGSLTCLPIVETQMGDISAYIPTNIISITDGQIFLESDLFQSGIKPAVNVGISVSRVGGKAQIKAMRDISGPLRLGLAQYREKESFTLISSEMDDETQKQLNRGAILTEILKQQKNDAYPIEDQIIVILAANLGCFDDIPMLEIRKIEKQFIEAIRNQYPKVVEDIKNGQKVSEENKNKMREILTILKEKLGY